MSFLSESEWSIKRFLFKSFFKILFRIVYTCHRLITKISKLFGELKKFASNHHDQHYIWVPLSGNTEEGDSVWKRIVLQNSNIIQNCNKPWSYKKVFVKDIKFTKVTHLKSSGYIKVALVNLLKMNSLKRFEHSFSLWIDSPS